MPVLGPSFVILHSALVHHYSNSSPSPLLFGRGEGTQLASRGEIRMRVSVLSASPLQGERIEVRGKRACDAGEYPAGETPTSPTGKMPLLRYSQSGGAI